MEIISQVHDLSLWPGNFCLCEQHID